ncbi:MAG TPA: cytochrome C oxidase subunit II [Chromatiales bacterium]|nr:cytochrome C oxidase subunit II [Chromatiales bacterium]
MSAILPPSQRLWWKEPVERIEIVWIAIAFVWCLILTFMMPYWHVFGKQNLSNEAYRTTPQAFAAKAQAVVDKWKVREVNGVPVVKPPAGADIYLVGRLWQWWPAYELKKGESYRLHLSSMDWQHGFSLQPVNINTQVLPGYEMVVTVTPNKSGEYTIVCNEYCGVGHHTMLGKIYVVD